MSASVTTRTTEPILRLPGGFPPDAVGFAVRTVLALMLAYYVSFWIQLSCASTAGICVAIVAQPQTGGAMSKAVYRVIGTLIGGIAAVITTAAFGQDRTMLLAVFTLWLAGCSFTASLLKEFRTYGAALAGYTLAIVSITNIDLPQDVFLTALDRVAAILIGVVSLLLVNGIFGPANAWQALTGQLRLTITQTTEQAIRTMRGAQAMASVADEAECATAILALRTQATFVAGELQDGWQSAAGARNAIVALLGMLSASRAIAAGLARTEPGPAVRLAIDRSIKALRETTIDTAHLHPPHAEPHEAVALPQAFLLERLDDLRAQHAFALGGLATLAIGRQPVRRVRLRAYHDLTGATRTAIVTALATLFCIHANWSGATFLLVQIAAVVTLLGMQPNPTQAAIAFAAQVPLAVVAAGLVKFFLLPQTGNFLSFTLAVAPFALAACVLARHPRTGAGATTGMLTWYVLMLAPTNPPQYEPAERQDRGGAAQRAWSLVDVRRGEADLHHQCQCRAGILRGIIGQPVGNAHQPAAHQGCLTGEWLRLQPAAPPGRLRDQGTRNISVLDSDSFWVTAYFEETKLHGIHIGDPAKIELMGFNAPLKGHVNSIARGINSPNYDPGTLGLASVNPMFTWVRLAQRIPVRIQIDEIPPDVLLAAGETATVSVRPLAKTGRYTMHGMIAQLFAF